MTNWQLVLTTLSVTVAIGSFVVALVMGVANSKRANKADQHQSEGELKDFTTKQTQQTILLEQVGKDVADIKHDMRRFDDKFEKVTEKLITHTNNIDTIWKKIDEIKEYIGFGKGSGSNGK